MRGMRTTVSIAAVLMGLAGCAGQPQPRVALYASESAAQALDGTWEGQYFSSRTQRYGSIRFTLVARADSASGEVLMLTPRRDSRGTDSDPRADVPRIESRPLSIAFVMAQGDSVKGMMEPYPDENGSILATRFRGRIRGDAIRGDFITQNTSTSEVSTGTWDVKRKTR